jgi:DNA polymerase III subunit epsilon
MYLFIDTETTGKENAKICQLAMVFTDNSLNTKGIVSSYIKPEGWFIPKSATAYHGITQEQCELFGLPVKALLKVFNFYADKSDLIIAHNAKFDKRCIEQETSANGLLASATPWYCTMENSTPILAIPNATNRGYKWPKLSEAFKFFTGQDLQNAHDALWDTRACREVFRGIKKHQQSVNLELVE